MEDGPNVLCHTTQVLRRVRGRKFFVARGFLCGSRSQTHDANETLSSLLVLLVGKAVNVHEGREARGFLGSVFPMELSGLSCECQWCGSQRLRMLAIRRMQRTVISDRAVRRRMTAIGESFQREMKKRRRVRGRR